MPAPFLKRVHPDDLTENLRDACQKSMELRGDATFFEMFGNNPGLIGYYASSEGGGISVLDTGEFGDYAHTVGRATFRTKVQVVDDRDRPVNAGETGRLRYRGPGVARRFIDADGKEKVVNPEGWFYPGDLAAKLDSGHIVLPGRDKDIINRGVINVYPADIAARYSGMIGG